jgi:AraC-like DNA-binding protein
VISRSPSFRAAQCAHRVAQLKAGQEITRADAQAAHQRLLAARRQAQRQCYAAAAQLEKSARLHLQAEILHRRANDLALGDPQTHAYAAADRHHAAAVAFDLADRRRQQARNEYGPHEARSMIVERNLCESLPLRRAIAYLERNARHDLTISDVAAAVYLTPPTVQLMFRRQLNCTPMEFLRRIRLRGADAELRAAVPGSGSVTEIAARWGFTHTGRFAKQYRAEYGCSPSVTLRTAPPSAIEAASA